MHRKALKCHMKLFNAFTDSSLHCASKIVNAHVHVYDATNTVRLQNVPCNTSLYMYNLNSSIVSVFDIPIHYNTILQEQLAWHQAFLSGNNNSGVKTGLKSRAHLSINQVAKIITICACAYHMVQNRCGSQQRELSMKDELSKSTERPKETRYSAGKYYMQHANNTITLNNFTQGVYLLISNNQCLLIFHVFMQ